MRWTRAGIVAFAAAVLAGPWYTVAGYRVTANLVSELAAQHTRHRGVMVAGFVGLGVALVVDGVRRFQPGAAPVMAFGACMALAGLFGHRPIDPAVPYDRLADAAHAALATLAGIAITVALLWHGVRVRAPRPRAVALALAALCLGLPLAMLAWPAVRGLTQRLMYLLVLAWLWRHYPNLDRT